jgi:protein-tyrosine phosphatase
MCLVNIFTKNRCFGRENLNRFTDVHCHILPGVDDGAKNMQQTEEMLRFAYREGVCEIITTPHFFASGNNIPRERLEQVLHQTQEMAGQQKIPIRLFSGNEIYYTSEAARLLEAGEICTLAGSRYVLVEFDPSVEYSYLRNGVLELVSYGYLPILAHTERYGCLFEKKERLQRIREHGAYLQVNTASFSGSIVGSIPRRTRYLLKQELIDLVGTDAHNTADRSPRIGECGAYLEKKLGREKAERILCENPRAILLDINISD